MHLTFDGQYFVQLRPEVYKAALKAAPSASAAGVGVGRTGSPTMGFADWGKGDKVATASHILVKELELAEELLEDLSAERSFGISCVTHNQGQPFKDISR